MYSSNVCPLSDFLPIVGHDPIPGWTFQVIDMIWSYETDPLFCCKYFLCSKSLQHTEWFNWNLKAPTVSSLRWRHNGRDSISNHQPHDCLLNRLFRRRSKKPSKLRVSGLCAGNSPGTGEFPAQMASNAENVSIWWRHHAFHRLFTEILSFATTNHAYLYVSRMFFSPNYQVFISYCVDVPSVINSSMDKQLIPLWNVTLNYLSIPKLQRCSHWGLKQMSNFNPHFIQLWWIYPLLALKLIHVCKRDPWGAFY